MSDPVPIYRQILAAGCDPADNTITMALEADGGIRTRIDIDAGIAGAAIAVLTTEASKLITARGPADADAAGTLRAQAVWLSGSPEAPILVFELQNGSLLPFELGTIDLAGLAAEMALLAAKPKGMAH